MNRKIHERGNENRYRVSENEQTPPTFLPSSHGKDYPPGFNQRSTVHCPPSPRVHPPKEKKNTKHQVSSQELTDTRGGGRGGGCSSMYQESRLEKECVLT